ncbi:Beta-ketoadipate enol-lactone hydrolase [Pseudonocardia sp. Ae406_Ps2]|uniref:alpha/beta fold hydrolase n=1 Tax=unclassified Pseudonocardia TaxID=2619320 RepID=UPI00095F396A|nr:MULTISPECIES: alpha/beta hydrolase [unclassified Pseudonocardia]OLM00345.1 Beta-ketoadipate enol-lactone hydrolase [Pseudonocardia sp. Ae406_Ps2]OLM07864.1 Beta-ketoadipate enol-lactone hydrolase [Pseudonocardia sp. Ae331_Ps2]OLM13886.1 Beta-ketoadipate enol-lactone hydrolase [Pseudonocardia sp. Ae505_Ps2]OLM21914.1 Beta-ketoadipate enol-lactone hydrolase [Pseudonocardia sp. Ae706_Ps2]OLM31003.1 Beta-ketoadipate enol-lactone hydrolase [Pseudonocardia sp. Ae717_Ps2]
MPAVPSSPPLVLLPGMNCSARLWGPAGAGALHPVLDRPTLDEQVQALLDALPDRFALGGLSLGGIVAMALTRRAPERVAGLCLMATNARAPTPEQRAGWDAALTRLDDGAPARALQPLDLLLHDRSLDATALQMADETGERRLAAQLRLQGTRVDERPALPAVAVPTLVLAGEQDRLCPVERHTEIAELVPDARLHVLPGVGHLLPVEDQDTVAALLGEWLSEVHGRSAR